ncbi:hypothetical protein [Helicobacter suis]|uniref:hypothetical protein n=1 Tax=Helicobacter suis TaxID=104628 RepID=UPI001F072363|nr:hypothetical protein [Helicobacter suis]
MTRRKFILTSCGVSLCLLAPLEGSIQPIKAMGIVEVFADGAHLSAVVVAYDKPLSSVIASAFKVEGRTIQKVYLRQSPTKGEASVKGKFVILELSLDDAQIDLKEEVALKQKKSAPKQVDKPRFKAGEPSGHNLMFKTPKAHVDILNSPSLEISSIYYPVVEDFIAQDFYDETNHQNLHYNLFIPKDIGKKHLPLVLFIHDAGSISTFVKATLLQGLGAVIFAHPKEQIKRPCFVLAPQYDTVIVDDDSKASPLLDTTIHLIQSLSKKYPIDLKRLYTTGQSMGCMASIAMLIKYPNFFAGAFLVAGQWKASLCAPLLKDNLFIMVSADDPGAYPGENAIVAFLEQKGAKIAKGVWNGAWQAKQFKEAYEKLSDQKATIRYVVFSKGSVLSPTDTNKGSAHRNTWKIAYSIEPIREWLFEQVLA